MSEGKANAYSHYGMLHLNEGATAAAVDIITSACGAGDDTHKAGILAWAIEEDNLKKLRDKIKESASGD
ncbi:hypothetical protein [Vreelandella arcis]|uniref:Uncharacterized protein n=1 Tax=Vreelandella arcis TaxID=416873 RepID=A0A1H0H801_9GAMM|nr:hypothetical protein [Halomonas arcis]SDO15262.1 hypothetical protein SAMN04487951_11483 [Halomonas arcis]